MAYKSRNLSQAEKKITAVKDEQLQKMTIVFSQNGQKLPCWAELVVILWTYSSLDNSLFSAQLYTTVIIFSAWDKLRNYVIHEPAEAN